MWDVVLRDTGEVLATLDSQGEANKWHDEWADECMDMGGEPPPCDIRPHRHQWGPVEKAWMTGNPHRKCLAEGCKIIDMDFDDDETEE
jgi:hypothetical protein